MILFWKKGSASFEGTIVNHRKSMNAPYFFHNSSLGFYLGIIS